jgi:hypothetical protein
MSGGGDAVWAQTFFAEKQGGGPCREQWRRAAENSGGGIRNYKIL